VKRSVHRVARGSECAVGATMASKAKGREGEEQDSGEGAEQGERAVEKPARWTGALHGCGGRLSGGVQRLAGRVEGGVGNRSPRLRLETRLETRTASLGWRLFACARESQRPHPGQRVRDAQAHGQLRAWRFQRAQKHSSPRAHDWPASSGCLAGFLLRSP
jgi:hypothetical protein